jgi:ParB/RepB/Spo0J family partition protein
MSATTSYSLKRISPTEVAFSDSNPRGESEDQILKDETFERLKESVYKFGVLVPIVVHQKKGVHGKKYKLVDGERRLRAALATGAKRIPAHIAQSTAPTDDLVQAVHIHMLRKHWSPVAQARAVGRIISERRRNEPRFSEDEALEELQAMTGCTDTKLKSLRRAVQYDEEVLLAVDKRQLRFSYLVQFEESFVEQLEKYYPALLKKLAKKTVRESLVEKARKKVLTSTRALMENIVPVINRAKSKQEKQFVENLLEKFILSKDMPAEDVLKKFERRFPTAEKDVVELIRDITEHADTLTVSLKQLKAHDLASFPEASRALDKALRDLRTVLTAKFRAITRVGT